MAFLKKAKEQAPDEKQPLNGSQPQEELDEEAEAPVAEDTEDADEEGSDWPDSLAEPQQAELEAAVTMLYDVLYKNPQTGKAVLDQLIADEDPQMQAEATARAVVLVLTQLDSKLDLSNEVVPYALAIVADRVMELGAEVKGMKFEDNDILAILSAAAQGAAAAMGGGQEGQQADPAAQPPGPTTVQ